MVSEPLERCYKYEHPVTRLLAGQPAGHVEMPTSQQGSIVLVGITLESVGGSMVLGALDTCLTGPSMSMSMSMYFYRTGAGTGAEPTGYGYGALRRALSTLDARTGALERIRGAAAHAAACAAACADVRMRWACQAERAAAHHWRHANRALHAHLPDAHLLLLDVEQQRLLWWIHAHQLVGRDSCPLRDLRPAVGFARGGPSTFDLERQRE